MLYARGYLLEIDHSRGNWRTPTQPGDVLAGNPDNTNLATIGNPGGGNGW